MEGEEEDGGADAVPCRIWWWRRSEPRVRPSTRGLHSFTSDLNLSTFGTQPWVQFGTVGHKDSSS